MGERLIQGMSEPIITFVYPIIRQDFISKSLITLHRFTDREKFRVILVDQTIGAAISKDFSDLYCDMHIRQKNQGFAYAANTGLIHGLRWGTPYLAVVNDDTEFMYSGWLEDALEEFKTDPRIIAVNPEAPRIPMWGYGMTRGEYVEILPYKANYTPEDIAYLKKGDYNEVEINSRHHFEDEDGNVLPIPKSFPFTKRGVVDGFAGWLPIFKREGLLENGLYDERFVWGGGEDYDWMARAYSCAWPIARTECNPDYHKRAVSTMKSWVWHHWGKSKDESTKLNPELFKGREGWNHLNELWTPNSDPWGHTDGKPNQRVPEIYIHKP